MKNKYKKIIAYSSLFVFCFFFFLYKTFPYAKMKNYLVRHVVQNRIANVEEISIDELHPYWFTGFEFKKLKFVQTSETGMGRREFNIDSAKARITIASIFKILMKTEIYKFSLDSAKLEKAILNNLQLKYQFDAYGGGGLGYLLLSEPKMFKIEAGKFNLQKMEFLKDLLGGGYISGELRELGINAGAPEGKLDKLNGNVIVKILDGSIDNVKIKFFSIPLIQISTFQMNLRIKDGNVQINNCSLTGDLSGKISGSIKLEPNLAYSKLNVSVSLTPSGNIANEFSGLLNTFMKPDSSGAYSFKLKGQLSFPEIEKK